MSPYSLPSNVGNGNHQAARLFRQLHIFCSFRELNKLGQRQAGLELDPIIAMASDDWYIVPALGPKRAACGACLPNQVRFEHRRLLGVPQDAKRPMSSKLFALAIQNRSDAADSCCR